MIHSSPEKEETMGIDGTSVSPRSEDRGSEKRTTMVSRYKECMKNYAASMGRHATDGCGEFMPCEAPSSDSYKCSACGCHRSFHRKEIQCSDCSYSSFTQHNCHHTQFPSALFDTSDHHANGQPTHSQFHNSNILRCPNKSGSSDYNEEQDEQEKEVAPKQKRRIRTKFTQEQKDKMQSFAEKAEWRMQKLDASTVEGFCQEIGIERRVLRVWMHNNKYNFAKKSDEAN